MEGDADVTTVVSDDEARGASGSPDPTVMLVGYDMQVEKIADDEDMPLVPTRPGLVITGSPQIRRYSSACKIVQCELSLGARQAVFAGHALAGLLGGPLAVQISSSRSRRQNFSEQGMPGFCSGSKGQL